MKWQKTVSWRILQVKYLWFLYRRGHITFRELAADLYGFAKHLAGSVGGSR